MFASRYDAFLPAAVKWIRDTLEAHEQRKRTVADFGFRRLPLYFPPSLLHATTVVVTDEPPVPPLSAWGLSELAWFETQPRAVTYQDTYFIETSAANLESVHFHELVHAIQWRVLGPEDFLLMYAAGLSEHGYADCPLEAMAYQHQARFEAGGPPYSVEAAVGAQTLALLPKSTEPSLSCCDLFDSATGERVSIEGICARVGPGWRLLLSRLLCKMSAAGWDGHIAQVKEKMGHLWLYIDQDRGDLWDMIELTAERSAFTCEICGAAPPKNLDGSATTCRCEVCGRR